MNNQVLIVDDEIEMCVSLQKLFRAHGIETDYCTDATSACEKLPRGEYSILIADLKMPGINGIGLLQNARNLANPPSVIIISGYASTDSVVDAMRCGALNFYEKPIPFPKLLQEVQHVLREKRGVQSEPSLSSSSTIITADKHTQELIAIAKKAAMTDAPIIIAGKSGTGKELFTTLIHEHSRRRDKPFIKVNCAAIPETLLESELFGFERGAFTGANEMRKGKFETANGGTLFFDEIGDMSLKTQAKLLRVLQEKEFERLGSSKTMKVDLRFVAATNQDLKRKIDEGLFREDLYFRLSVILIELPSLHERVADILPIARYYLDLFNKRYGKRIVELSDPVKQILMVHNWPGNVRELRNCVERAVIFCERERIEVDDLPMQYHPKAPIGTPSLGSFYESVDREMVLNALEKAQGSRTRAAQILNISRKTLYLKMKKLGIET